MSNATRKDWMPCKLNELGFVGRGKSRHRPRNAPELYGGSYPFIQTAEVTASEFYITEYSQTYTEAGLAQSKTWDKDTLCIVIAGENTAETAILKFRACFPDSIIGFIADTDKTDVRFIKYYLSTIKKQLRSVTKGATQDNLSVEKLLSFDILTPPLPVQKKIAVILSAYDDLIENNTRRIKILEEMARSLYREWFVHFRFPGHEQVKMVDSELGLIPEGWAAFKLGDIAQEVRRSVDPSQIDPKTPYLGLEHLPRKSIALSGWGTANQVQSTKLTFKKGEILFGKIRPYFHKVCVAPVNGVCSADAIVISAKAFEYFSIVLACVSSEEFVNHATQTSQGTKMPRANWDVLIKYPVAIPPLPLLHRFNEFVQDIVEQIQNFVFRNRNLRHTRDLLLPKLISGEIDVENLDINTGDIAA